MAQLGDLKDLKIPVDVQRYGDYPMRTGGKSILQFFVECVAKGTSPRMAESLAMQEPPGIRITDTTFIADQNRHGRSILDRMGGDQRSVEALRKNLARNGYKLQSDDHYIPTVARFPGDPKAIVNQTRTMSDLRKDLQQSNREVHGEINQSHTAAPRRMKKHRLHPRIVQQIDRTELAENPKLKETPAAARYERIVEKHGSAPEKA